MHSGEGGSLVNAAVCVNIHPPSDSRGHRSGALRHDAIGWVGEPQHVTGDFLDQIGMREFGRQQRDISLKLRPGGFEAFELELEEAYPFDEP